jgi:hypothetical protein
VVLVPLDAFFRLPVPFVAHFARAELFCLWKLALPTPDSVWDTCLAERAFQLGVHHPRCEPTAHRLVPQVILPTPHRRAKSRREPPVAASMGVG